MRHFKCMVADLPPFPIFRYGSLEEFLFFLMYLYLLLAICSFSYLAEPYIRFILNLLH